MKKELADAEIGDKVRIVRRLGGNSEGVVIKKNSRYVRVVEFGNPSPINVYLPTARSVVDRTTVVELMQSPQPQTAEAEDKTPSQQPDDSSPVPDRNR